MSVVQTGPATVTFALIFAAVAKAKQTWFALPNLLTSSLWPLLFFYFHPGLNCTFKILCRVPYVFTYLATGKLI